MLIELLVALKSLELSKEQETKLKISVEKLLYACGVQCADKTKRLVDMLDYFAVSTERSKTVPPLPKPGDLGLLRQCKYITPEAQARAKIKTKEKNKTVNVCNEMDVDGVKTVEQPKVDYYHTRMLCDAIEIVVKDKWPSLLIRAGKNDTPPSIGHKLLKHWSHPFLHDSTEFIRGVKLFEQKVYYELKHMQRMSPLKCQNAEKRRSTSIDEKNCMLLECNMSKKRAAEGLLQLASCKKAKRIKKRCAVTSCDCTNNKCTLRRVPIIPPLLKSKSPSIRRQIT